MESSALPKASQGTPFCTLQAANRGFALAKTGGGDGEIRTLDALAGILAFQASALGHYATSPNFFNLRFLFPGPLLLLTVHP